MWCCWISPDDNSVSIQRSPRSGYRAPKSSKPRRGLDPLDGQASEQGLVPKNAPTFTEPGVCFFTWACNRLVGQVPFLLLIKQESHYTRKGCSDNFLGTLRFSFVVVAPLCLNRPHYGS